MIGQTIAHYEATDKLVEGGVGVVYRGRDTKLGREVAFKVLPEVFADDEQRMVRFEREARVLASLNHPHIASIYGLEQQDGVRALVMELVEGPTLADRIAEGPIPLDEALPLAHRIAEALEHAHEHGVVHRDLKPANIKLTADGNVKIFDFGLAKTMSGDSSSPDLSESAQPRYGTAVLPSRQLCQVARDRTGNHRSRYLLFSDPAMGWGPCGVGPTQRPDDRSAGFRRLLLIPARGRNPDHKQYGFYAELRSSTDCYEMSVGSNAR